MYQQNMRQYDRGQAVKNPFKKEPKPDRKQNFNKGLSGSKWGLSQLEWLYVKFDWQCDISEMLSEKSRFKSGSVLQKSVIDMLNKPWIEIKDKRRLNPTTLYATLSQLAQKTEHPEVYDPSSSLEDASSQRKSVRSNSSSQSESHNQRMLGVEEAGNDEEMQNFKERALDEGGEDNDSRGGTEWGSNPDLEMGSDLEFEMESNPDPRSSYPTYQRLSEGDLDANAKEKEEGSLPVHYVTEQQYRLGRHKGPQNLGMDEPSIDNDSSLGDLSSSQESGYEPVSSEASSESRLSKVQNISKKQLKAENKHHNEVQAAARAWANELVAAFEARCEGDHKNSDMDWGLTAGMHSENADQFKIDSLDIASNPDVVLLVTAEDRSKVAHQDRQVRLLFECKPAVHNLNVHQIGGQEFSHMVGEALRLRDYLDGRWARYTVFLVSWHHLECYFSRMDVTDAYLVQLHDTSGLSNHERPHVRRSKVKNLRIDSERVEAGEICARMVIELLAQFNRPTKLGIIQHLIS